MTELRIRVLLNTVRLIMPVTSSMIVYFRVQLSSDLVREPLGCVKHAEKISKTISQIMSYF